MQTIKNTIQQIQCHLEYVQSNTDYTSDYDLLLADDFAYSPDAWLHAISEALPVRCVDYLDNYVLDKMATAIIENPTGYCDVEYKRKSFPHGDKLAVAQFPIGEIEIQVSRDMKWQPAIDYIERETETTYCGGFFYYNAGYDVVSYTLRPADILELFEQIATDEWADNAELLLSDSRGVYIPRDFCDLTLFAAQLDADCIADLSNPENERYFDTWDWVLNQSFVLPIGSTGRTAVFRLHQDGDLWAYKATMNPIGFYHFGA